MRFPQIAIALSVLVTQAAVPAFAHTIRQPERQQNTRLPTLVKTLAAGQQEFSCVGTASICPEFEVFAAMIPSAAGGVAGCIAAFPYKSLRISKNLLSRMGQQTLVWTLPTKASDPSMTPLRFGNPGVQVNSLTGSAKDLLQSEETPSANRIAWKLSAQPALFFAGNHQPNVEYQSGKDWLPCTPVDPVITNND